MATVDAAAVVELRRRLVSHDLVPYRFLDGKDMDWRGSPAGTDASLRRFLVARKGDVAAAEHMFAAHLDWRSRAFPMDRGSVVQDILEEKRRFIRLGTDSDGRPVICCDFLWGFFLEGVSAEDCIRAALIFLEGELALADAAGIHQARVLCYGGPPPLEFAATISAILSTNYPERTCVAVIYPVPPMIARTVRLFLWFLDEGTKSKVRIEHKESDILSLLQISIEDLPLRMRGGLKEVDRQLTKENHSRINALLWRGVTGGGRAEAADIQRRLVQRHDLDRQAAAKSRSKASQSGSSWFSCCLGREADGEATPEPLARKREQEHPTLVTDPTRETTLVPKMAMLMAVLALLVAILTRGGFLSSA